MRMYLTIVATLYALVMLTIIADHTHRVANSIEHIEARRS